MKKIILTFHGVLVSFFLFSQNVGVGTTTPQGKLHITNGPLVNAQYSSVATGIFENSSTFSSGIIQLMNPSTKPFSIISGTDLTFSRSSISFQTDSSLTFETGSGAQRMKIDKAGTITIPNKLGIGNTDPIAKLHVTNNGSLANAQYFSSGTAVAVFENASTFSSGIIQLMNPATKPFSIVSGTDITSSRSSVSFQVDSSLTFETGTGGQRMKIDKTGLVTIPNRLGIGNADPVAKFHVTNNGALANAQYFSSSYAVGVFENSSTFNNAGIQLMNPSTRSFSISSGTDITLSRSSISFQADSSLTFETGGFLQQMKIDKTGSVIIPNKVGIGNISPVTKLHVANNGSLANAQYISSGTVVGVFENASAFNNASIQLMNPSNRPFSIVSGTDLAVSRSSISFQADSSLTIETGNGSQRMKIDKAGVVTIPNSLGISTTTPSANLDVSGTAVIGVNGTVLTEVIKVTLNKNVANVPANSSITEIFTVPNTQTTSTVYISPSSALSNGLLIGYARVFPAGSVEVRFTNVTASSIDPAAMDFYITVIR